MSFDGKTPERRIIIAEDDESMNCLLTFMMEREGFDVRSTSDGREASQLIKSLGPVDIVVLDQLMPFKSGMQLIAEIRAMSEWDNVPIIMLTSKNQERDLLRALELGANEYLTKPFNPKELMARIKRHLK